MGEISNADGYSDDEPIQLPSVIVKFHYDVVLPYIDNLENYIVEKELAPWKELESNFPGISIQRVYISLSPKEIQEMEDRAFDESTPISERPHLLKYYQIFSPPETDRDGLARAIRKWNIVEFSYVPLPIASMPDPPSHAAGSQSAQLHLDPAVGSIGAEVAWETPSADGRGMRFIDLERGWLLNHQNFLSSPATSVFSLVDPPPSATQATSEVSTTPDSISHGTSVLGTVTAPDFGGTGLQTIGIAFKASGQAISIKRIPAGGGTAQENIHDAITKASSVLSEGDVILIEAQAVDSARKLWPVEVNKLEYEEIRIVTKPNNNRVVIEAAGNGTDITPSPPNGTQGNSLDLLISNAFPGGPLHILDRSKQTEFKDSGAIMVGSATSGNPHFRMTRTNENSESNFGTRVDCYAWGQNIFTTGGPNTTSYDLHFGSTSGASAIIAGAALIIQGLAKAYQKGDNPTPTNRTYLPETLRKILGSFDPVTQRPWQRAAPDDDPPYGTKSNNPANDLIGVMPDLIKIIDKYMLLGPDVYLRDFLGDMGQPHAGLINSSPDIIVRNAQVPNYDSLLGQGSSNQNLNGLGEAVVKDGNNKLVYVRVTNRGTTVAQGVQVTVSWSEVATLLTPGMWHTVGTNILASIPAGEMRVCQIIWQDTTTNPIPPAGHYCFVGMVGNSRDPAPVNLTTFATWNDYYIFIRQVNNITWCNFNVVAMPSPPMGSGGFGGGPMGGGEGNNEDANLIILPFLATGAQFEDLPMQLEVDAELPERAQLWLEGSESFLAALNEDRTVDLGNIKEKGTKRIIVNPRGRNLFRDILFPRDLREQMKLIVNIPSESRQQPYEIYVRQLHKSEEVGRITWRLVPPEKKRWWYWIDYLRQFFAALSPLNCLLFLLLALSLLIILVLVLMYR